MRGLATAILTSALLYASPADAQLGVTIHEIAENGVRVDGSLRDWRRVRFVAVGHGNDGAMRFALGYDGRGMYVAASVRDERMVRTDGFGRSEDAIVVTIATPAGRGRYRATDLWLWAGVPGRSAGRVGTARINGRPSALSSARIVEAPRRDSDPGYLLEAFIPWSAIPGSAGSAWQQGRVSLRLVDVDSEARPEVESSPSFGRVDPRNLGTMPTLEATGGESAMLRNFLRAQNISGTRPSHDLRGDVHGDQRPERIIVVGHYLLIMGAGYRDGEAYDYFELPITGSAGVREAELRDLTADGKKELVLTLRQSNRRGSRDLVQTFSFVTDRIRPLWGVETRKQTRDGFVESRFRITRARRGPPLITITAGRAEGLDRDNFREAPATGIVSILLPWGPTSERVYQWDGNAFGVVRERENRDYTPPEAARPAQQQRRRPEPVVQAPRRPSVEQIVNEFKQRAGISRNARPSFRQVGNVAEGRQRERVLIFGKHLLVVGEAFRRGEGFFHFGIPVAEASDVLGLELADLTGDGRRELMIRIRRVVGEGIEREILLVHQFRRGGTFPRLLAYETARHHDGNRIDNRVRVVRGTLVAGPGRARGWTARTWPFQDGTGDGVDAILLPWRDSEVRYRYRLGDRLRRP